MKVLDQRIGDRFAIYHGDSCEVLKGIPDNSIHYSIFSPPFASLYAYSNSERDLGNVKDSEEFFQHFAFMITELFRVLKPGRLLSMHCMLLPASKERDGYIGLKDFRGDLVRAFQGREAADLHAAMTALRSRAFAAMANGDNDRALRLGAAADVMQSDLAAHPGESGFIFHSEVAIWKDPVTTMQRTKALGLLHKTIRKDSAMSRQGINDYVVTMRKPGANDEPIAHTAEEFPVAMWQRYASPVWVTTAGVDDEGFGICAPDIDPGDTLQYRSARENDDERHICPLQLDVIRRCLRLWTSPNDVVLSPFGGIGSEGVVAVEEGRRAVLVELKKSYYEQAARNLAAASPNGSKQLDIFSLPTEAAE